MDDKSRLKVGDLVRRPRLREPEILEGAGMVIEIFHWANVMAAQVKWLDTSYGQSQWYLHQLRRVVKE